MADEGGQVEALTAGPHSFHKWAFSAPPKFDYQKSPAALLIRRPKGVTFGRLYRNPAVRELGDERTVDSIHGPTTTIDSAGSKSPALTCCAVVVACTMGLVAEAVVVE